jgi:predicted transcriptional regulator
MFTDMVRWKGTKPRGVENMATERSNDLRAFKSFVEEKLSSAGDSLTLDEALTHWEYENQTDEQREVTLQAIRQGLADVEAGRVRPFEDFDHEFRQKRGLPPRT